MNITIQYTLLGFSLNSIIDRGEVLDIHETRKAINEERIFPWLKDKYGQDVDISLYSDSDLREINDLFANLNNVVDAESKFGIKRNGLCLLLAYCIEGIQNEVKI